MSVVDLRDFLSDEERAEFDALVDADIATAIWRPNPGPQLTAYDSQADVIGFGGAAGGGKTDVAIGKALTQHQVVQFFRREGTELGGIIDRMEQVLNHRDGLGGKPPVWRAPWGACRLVEFGSVPNLGDERKFQGRPKDLLVIDEAANFLEAQVRFLMGWVRSADLMAQGLERSPDPAFPGWVSRRPAQPCQTLLTFNPPTNAEGRWVVQFFAPWLDKRWAGKRAAPGELQWVASIAGRDVWLGHDSRCFVMEGRERVYDFDPEKWPKDQIIRPQSRTFIPSRVTDNPFLVGTNYLSVLQALPEPLRSQMLYGDFEAGMQDDPWQVVPTLWVEQAQARYRAWKVLSAPLGEQMTLGVDVARGGKDKTVIAPRHRTREGAKLFATPIKHPGSETPNGSKVAGLVLAELRDSSPILIDVIGVGASPYDKLVELRQQVLGVNVSEKSVTTDRSGRLRFFNLRSEVWWGMREALDPEHNPDVMLSDEDPEILADLCAPRWEVQGSTIKVESREDIVKRIGRSPDTGTALVLANIDLPKVAVLRAAAGRTDVLNYTPTDHLPGDDRAMGGLDWDPMSRL